MEIRQLRYFVATYEEMSVTQAARRLNVVQPALSQQISKLEAELGQQLFFRTTKGMEPTQAGREAYEMFAGILSELDFARQRLEERQGTVRGTVAIGVVTTIANYTLGEVLSNFNAKYPNVVIRATGGYTTDLYEMLKSSQLDIIVVNAPLYQKNPNMVDIVTEDLALVCAADNPVRFDGPVSLERIDGLDLALPSQRHGLRLVIDKATREHQIALSPQIEIDEIRAIEDFVRMTRYFTILPPIGVLNALRQGQLVAYPIAPRIPRRLVYVTHGDRALTRAAELLIDEIREKMIDVSHALDVVSGAEG